MTSTRFASAFAVGALLAAPALAAQSPSAHHPAKASKPLCSTLKKEGKQAAPPDCIADRSDAADPSANNPASASYGGLPDTSSNAESSMPSTASSPSSSMVYDDRNSSSPRPAGAATSPKSRGDSK